MSGDNADDDTGATESATNESPDDGASGDGLADTGSVGATDTLDADAEANGTADGDAVSNASSTVQADEGSIDEADGLVRTVVRGVVAGMTGGRLATDPPLTQDEVFEILSNERRRHVVRYLREEGWTGELGDIATQVAAWELDIPVKEVSSTERKRVYTTLQQTHLPKMDDIGAVIYDSDSGRVEAADVLEDVDIYLEFVPGGELAWKEYYLALSIVSVALVAVVAVGVFPFSVLPTIVWAGGIAAAFLVSAAAHVYYDRSLEIGESP